MKKLGIVAAMSAFVLNLGAAQAESVGGAKSRCATKMKNSASMTLALADGVAVQEVAVKSFTPGLWTAAGGDNFGHATIEVQSSLSTRAYDVSGKQIGSTDDCSVKQVKEISGGGAQAYECRETVDCMPIVSEENRKYCRNDYIKWAEKNCGFTPSILN